MDICAVTCVLLFLAVEDVWGSEMTINVKKNDSVTLMCPNHENLRFCSCPPNFGRCYGCTSIKKPVSVKTSGDMVYYTLQGLEQRDSGQYECYTSSWRLGKVYKLNVLEGRDSTTVIGIKGQSIVMSCAVEQDITAASEKHWCHLNNASFCESDTVLGPEDEARGDFKILDTTSSFSLEKQNLAQSDVGSYRLTINFHNHTKVCEVKVQVTDEPRYLEIVPVQVHPKPDQRFEINCRYSQDLKDYYKSWICDNSECPQTVKIEDDRFQSVLILTIDNAGCSKIKSFQCVVHMQETTVKSRVHYQPEAHVTVVRVNPTHDWNRRKQIHAYSLLNLTCVNSPRYARYDRRGFGYHNYDYFDYNTISWCKVQYNRCSYVNENVEKTTSSLTVQICVKPNDDGAMYRCNIGRDITEVELDLGSPPPPPPPPPPRLRPNLPPNPPVDKTPSGSPLSVGIIVILSCTFLLIIALSIAVFKCKDLSKLRRRCGLLFRRRMPLSAVDIDASTYANSVANYYRQNHGQVNPADEQGQGDDGETSTSSDDEFEELPVCRQKSLRVTREESDYITVKPAVAHSQDTREGGGKGNTKKTSTEKVARKQQKNAAQRNSEQTHESEDEEDEVTYTHVTFNPKHRK